MGTVRFEATVRSGDGQGRVEWRLSGPRAALVLGSAGARPTPYDPLTWTASRVWDSTGVPDGTYTLRVLATDGDGNRSEVSALFRVQNGAPSRPVAFTTATGPVGVVLTWQQATSADAALYRLYRDGAAAPLAELTSDRRSFVDTSISPGDHVYQLVLVDRTGHRSDPATAKLVVPAAPAADVPRPVLQLRVLFPSGEALMSAGRVTDRLLLLASVAPPSSVDGPMWGDLARGALSVLHGTPGAISDLAYGLLVQGPTRLVGGVVSGPGAVVGLIKAYPGILSRSLDIRQPDTMALQWLRNYQVYYALTPQGQGDIAANRILTSRHPWTEFGVNVFDLSLIALPIAGEARAATIPLEEVSGARAAAEIADTPMYLRAVAGEGPGAKLAGWSKSARMRAAGLPFRGGSIRYVPPEDWHPSTPLPRGENNGYIDRFENEWVKGPSRTAGEPYEWDVQLSDEGRASIGWLSSDGEHVNVSMGGWVTH